MQHQEHFGRKFYLDKKTGYWISTDYPRTRAHVWVWTYHFGEPGDGYHIHHRDGDKSNNSINNLQKLTEADHLSLHMTEERKRWAFQRMNEIRPLTKEWHSSVEGLRWHSEHGKKCWQNKKILHFICQFCNKEFQTKTSHQRFCSNACKSRNRRKIAVDDLISICLGCKKEFNRNKYAKRKYCSRKCGSGRSKNKVHKET